MGQHYRRFPHLTRVVRQIFLTSDIAILAYHQGILNLTAYARVIHPLVEKRARRKVSPRVIATLLSRHADDVAMKSSRKRMILPEVVISKLFFFNLRHQLVRIKVKFDHSCRSYPGRFLVVLAKLAVYQVPLLRLRVDNGDLELVVTESHAGTIVLALRELIKQRRKKFTKKK